MTTVPLATSRACLCYAVLSYLFFVATIVYAIGFFGNMVVTRTIDSVAIVPLGEALLTNVTLLSLFALQHSGMARPAFKRWLTRLVPPQVERSTYVLTSSLTLITVMALWQPMGGVVWQVDNAVVATAIRSIYFAGWGVMLIATWLIDHWDLFGVRQAVAYCRGSSYEPPSFRAPALYRVVRHPIYLGWLLVLWASPFMTVTHLVAALGLTAYIVFGARLEERDLVRELHCYRQYQRKVPMLLPSLHRRLDSEQNPCR
jgi:protein-S-isoprenylcysteine O-methyltransferase Ste14